MDKRPLSLLALISSWTRSFWGPSYSIYTDNVHTYVDREKERETLYNQIYQALSPPLAGRYDGGGAHRQPPPPLFNSQRGRFALFPINRPKSPSGGSETRSGQERAPSNPEKKKKKKDEHVRSLEVKQGSPLTFS